MTDKELDAVLARAEAAFRAPWTYTRFEVVCDRHEYEDCAGDGLHDVVRVESPDEYPGGQVVADVLCEVPGLEGFAKANGEFIAAARTDVPALVAEVRRLRDALNDAVGLAKEMVVYVPEYFREKWTYDAWIEQLRAAGYSPTEGGGT